MTAHGERASPPPSRPPIPTEALLLILGRIHLAALVAIENLRPRTRAGVDGWLKDASKLEAEFSKNTRRDHLPVLACRSGCVHCCYQKVQAAPLEAALIADQAPSLPLSRAPLRPGWPRPCALLSESGLCQVYPLRPSPCRSWHSYDALACARGLGHTHPYSREDELPAECIGGGLLAACEVLGLDSEIVDLSLALLERKDQGGAVDAWLSGAVLFQSARIRSRKGTGRQIVDQLRRAGMGIGDARP